MKDLINTILSEVFGDEVFEVTKTIELDGFLYVFSKQKDYNPYDDEMLRRTGGHGPLKINMATNEYEFMSILDFYSTFVDNKDFFPEKEEEPTLDWEKVFYNIRMRKRINSDDFVLLFEYNNMPRENLDIYSCNQMRIINVGVKDEKEANYVEEFLNSFNANYLKKNSKHFVVDLELDNPNVVSEEVFLKYS